MTAPYPTEAGVNMQHQVAVDSRAADDRRSKIRLLQGTAGTQIITGIILSAMGGTAMVLDCYWSRIGNAIWSGLCFFLITGIIGSGGTAQGGPGQITFYAVCSGLSAACGAQLFGLSIYSATQEMEYICFPYADLVPELCTYVIEARIGINACIAVAAFIGLIASLIASCVSCTVPAAPAQQTTFVIQSAPPPVMEAPPVSYPNPNANTTFVALQVDPSKPYGAEQPPPYYAN